MYISNLENSAKLSQNGRKLRVLLASHMHARVSRGGAEIAAFQMFDKLSQDPQLDVYMLAASGGKFSPPLGVGIFQPFNEREFVSSSHQYNHFIHANADINFAKDIKKLITQIMPDVVHLHHYTNFGVEIFHYIKSIAPKCKIALTLHEYLAICNHYGQMVKKPNLSYCTQASPRDCHKCFPEISEEDFFLRELFLKKFLGLVDLFISPSEFLAKRYVAWGIPEDKIVVIENGMPDLVDQDRPMPPTERNLTVGFFGQISKLKGMEVLIEAANLIAKSEPEKRSIRIEIHGDASNQPPELQSQLQSGSADSVLRFCGPYQHEDVGRLMQGCHAVLVPSIWWENSPMVIQEALKVRRPIICSDIGGMAEKVRDGIDGFHFRARSGAALADLLFSLADAPERLTNLQQSMACPPSLDETVARTKAIYGELTNQIASGKV